MKAVDIKVITYEKVITLTERECLTLRLILEQARGHSMTSEPEDMLIKELLLALSCQK